MRFWGILIFCLSWSGLVCAQLNLHFCNKAEACAKLATEDGTTGRWSRFDYESRLGKAGGTRQELMNFIVAQAMDWDDEDRKTLLQAASEINDILARERYRLPLPARIDILTTTMAEEGGAGGYTREQYIVVQDNLHNADPEKVKHLLAHELFHVLTRNNPEFRKDMYGLIGFTVTPEELAYPADLADRRISNPDVNRFDSYATFTVDGKPQDCSMVIYASKPYEGGSFFDYLTIGLVPMKDGKPLQEDGHSVVYSVEDASDFFEKVSRNTSYIINPEEILAENFSMALLGRSGLPSMELIERIRTYLQNR